MYIDSTVDLYAKVKNPKNYAAFRRTTLIAWKLLPKWASGGKGIIGHNRIQKKKKIKGGTVFKLLELQQSQGD